MCQELQENTGHLQHMTTEPMFMLATPSPILPIQTSTKRLMPIITGPWIQYEKSNPLIFIKN